MASANKTPGLALNSWLGTDSPKRADFNADNEKLDVAYGGLAARAASAEGRLAAHEGDGTMHVTAEEKAQWSGAGSGGGGGGPEMVTGAYVGTGTSSRTIELGFRPRCGFFFPVTERIVNKDVGSSGEFAVFTGFFSEAGSSLFVSVTDTGFSVMHQANKPAAGMGAKYNQSDTTYAYVAWK